MPPTSFLPATVRFPAFLMAVIGSSFPSGKDLHSADAASSATTLTLDASTTHQIMVGFGGALTWYSNWIFHSSETDKIQRLIFEDLGIDIVRFQNWYFPDNYPENKETAGMSDLALWQATARFYELAKAANPDIKVLLSSWGPPASLKSNGDTAGGTLKKVDGKFVYDAYAQYWVDTFDHLEFIPDYLSIQNEPGYVASWTTCEWRPSETEEFPGYDKAIDRVYHALKDRPQVPAFLAPEVENIGGASWDFSLNSFREFTRPLKERDHVAGYAYHLYNIYRLDRIDAVIPQLNMIRNEFGEKPNFMTEYSREFAGWLETARIIQNSLIEADTSAYIHWNMVWAPAENPDEESAMISITHGGQYEVEENYYALKHFAKFIDAGFIRVSLSGSDSSLRVSAFLRPDGRQLVIQAVNAAATERPVNWALGDAGIASVKAVRSTEGNYFVALDQVELPEQTLLPPHSLTTYILDLSNSLRTQPEPVDINQIFLAPAGGPVSLEVEKSGGAVFTLWKTRHPADGWTLVDKATIVTHPEKTIITDLRPGNPPVFYQVRLN